MLDDLFRQDVYQPLASRMRPNSLDSFFGQQHLIAPKRPLREAIDSGLLHSMIFWGPPGVGKTTLARIIAQCIDAHFESISAVLSGIKEIRTSVANAEEQRDIRGRQTILFVDEVHRFNKSQQDAFLPYVESGTIILVGATTENPSFELNNALLSRCRVYVLKSLSDQDIRLVLDSALNNSDNGLGSQQLQMDEDALSLLCIAADGDARRALNLLEIASDLATQSADTKTINLGVIKQILVGDTRRFDKDGEYFYDQISALQKSIRGSSADGGLYWLCRMLDGGCDPIYLARRLVRIANEDIGNADPRALELALNAWHVQERLGSPEGELALAQAVLYMAIAAKSNAVYIAFNAAMDDARSLPTLEVPLHLRNASTDLMKDLEYGRDYRCAHDQENGYVAGEKYLPDELADKRYYFPTDRGLEKKISEKLDYLSSLDDTDALKNNKDIN